MRFVAASGMILIALEAIACAEALALAEDCGIHKIKVASDFLNLVKNIKENPRCSYMMTLRDIQERAKAFDPEKFLHEGSDCNVEAHNLATLELLVLLGMAGTFLTPCFTGCKCCYQ